jgi:5-methyltetrahydrofolate--homocysteine methyltransferase
MSIEQSLSQAPLGLQDIELDDTPAVEIEIVNPEGVKIGMDGIEIDLMPEPEEENFSDNLAEYMDDSELQKIASDLIEMVDTDVNSRKDWVEMYVKGLEVLGMKYEERTEPWTGACGVFSTLLTEAAVRFQSETIIETFPAQGPVKTQIIGAIDKLKEEAAERVRTDMNFQLVDGMPEYRPEHERMLFNLGLAGAAFKKVYFDPSLGRQTSIFCPAEDIIIDPLVFPCATGDENYIGGAVETIEALRLIKANIPYVKTVLGVSNISFGLPAAAREIVNSVFLYYCTKAGLDLAIVNAEKLERFAGIPEHERRLAEHLLFNSPPIDVPADHAQFELLQNVPDDWRQQPKEQRAAVNQFHIAAITDHFRKAAPKVKAKAADLPLDERLASYIIQGSKDGLVEDLDRKRAEGANPLDIINGPLMAGMSEVGRLFNNNELIVAEVLQSAEARKTGVAHLEQFMEKADTAARGKIVLATVKGDVHDIGKNLVEIILANNGYTVVNLGIKILPETLIQAYREHKPDAIGLSGLLVKSTQQMVITADDFKTAGINVPLLVGGAALSEKFSKTRIAPAYAAPTFYCKDAMTGLRIMNEITDPATREAALASATWHEGAEAAPAPVEVVNTSEHRSTKVNIDLPIPPAPYYDRKKRDVPQLAELWSYINPFMLFGRHLGFKGNFEKLLAERDPKALELFHQVEEVKHWAAGFMKVRAVWQFFEVERHGNAINLYAHQGTEPIHTFQFGRQPKEDGLCLSDYILPVADDGRRDHIALLVVTAGEGIRERSEECKAKGEYLKAHALQALAIETAEGAAEWLHRRIREDWGFPDAPTMTMQERFTSRYRGKRYSFGYPACPNLDDQQGIWKLINPQEIGVELTEGMMMEPEASVSALVFQHPDCAYFTATSLETSEA